VTTALRTYGPSDNREGLALPEGRAKRNSYNLRLIPGMKIGYARVSTDEQNPARAGGMSASGKTRAVTACLCPAHDRGRGKQGARRPVANSLCLSITQAGIERDARQAGAGYALLLSRVYRQTTN